MVDRCCGVLAVRSFGSESIPLLSLPFLDTYGPELDRLWVLLVLCMVHAMFQGWVLRDDIGVGTSK